jgi:hypothetical protein
MAALTSRSECQPRSIAIGFNELTTAHAPFYEALPSLEIGLGQSSIPVIN